MSRLPEAQTVTKQELSISLNPSSSWCPLPWRRLEILGEVHPGKEQEQAPAGQGLPTRRLPLPAPASASTLLCSGAKIQVEAKEGVSPLDEFKNHHHIHS